MATALLSQTPEWTPRVPLVLSKTVARAFNTVPPLPGPTVQNAAFGNPAENVRVHVPLEPGVVPLLICMAPELSVENELSVHVAPVPAPVTAQVGAAPPLIV